MIPQPPWFVLVFEELGDSQNRRRMLSISQEVGPDLAVARDAAFRIACTHRPTNPWNLMSRAVFQTGPDSWVVQVEGQLTAYHFDVKVARLTAYQNH